MPKVMQIRNASEAGSKLRMSESVFFDFDDGTIAEFMPYREGLGYDVDGLRWLRLWRDRELLCEFACTLGRVQRARNEEHRFFFLADGFTQAEAAIYWEAARDHANAEYYEKPQSERRERPRELWLVWLVTHSAAGDLRMMKDGTAPLLAS